MNKVLLGVLLSGLFASSTMAANVTGNFQSTATLNSTCKLTASAINFGIIANSELNMNGEITSLCSNSVTYDIVISTGIYGNVSDRKMAGAISENTDRVKYQIYTNESRTNIWNNQTNQSPSTYVTIVSNGINAITPVYGKVLSGNGFLIPDNYSDTLSVTIIY